MGERLNIFLTNTLEDLERTTSQLPPLQILSNEANAAYEIKKHKPVLCIIGNPPYSGHSANKGEWITSLIRDYMRCDGKPLGERNPKWLHDDYVKFIRWSQWRIDQTGQGILAFITNHGYLDNPTFRGMRQSLMNTFDEIFVLDLHGNSKKKELVPGTTTQDKNVFDIQQGVAIGIFVKHPPSEKGKPGKKKPAVVKHAHLWNAQRKGKYEWLDAHDLANTKWTTLKPATPSYWFIPRDTRLLSEWEELSRFTAMMPHTVIGPNSHRDDFAIGFDKHEVAHRLRDLLDNKMPAEKILSRYKLQENDEWSVQFARENAPDEQIVWRCLYRPFDERYMMWGRHVFDRPREELLKHLMDRRQAASSSHARREEYNLALITTRQSTEMFAVFATRIPVGQHKLATPYDGGYISPLYLYPNGKLPEDDLLVRETPPEEERRPNFSKEFIAELCERLKATFTRDGLGEPKKRVVGPEVIFYYAYAVFHSPAYRARYAEFLRTDFPRLPLTRDWDLFRQLAGLGGHLVDLHARGKGESGDIAFPIKSDNVITDIKYETPQGKTRGRVWINDKQYFEGVPLDAWEFPIGGYLPAQRWLKDRAGRTLGFDDLETYPRIVNALHQTGRLMKEIDVVITEHGGWPEAFA